MPSKKHKPEEIIGKLREVEIVLGLSLIHISEPTRLELESRLAGWGC